MPSIRVERVTLRLLADHGMESSSTSTNILESLGTISLNYSISLLETPNTKVLSSVIPDFILHRVIQGLEFLSARQPPNLTVVVPA